MTVMKGRQGGRMYRFYLPKDLFGDSGKGDEVWVEVEKKEGVITLTPKTGMTEETGEPHNS